MTGTQNSPIGVGTVRAKKLLSKKKAGKISYNLRDQAAYLDREVGRMKEVPLNHASRKNITRTVNILCGILNADQAKKYEGK